MGARTRRDEFREVTFIGQRLQNVTRTRINVEGNAISNQFTFPFRTDRLVLVMPKNHPLGRRRRILFSEALENDFIGLGEGNAIQQFLAYQANRLNRRLDPGSTAKPR